MPKSWPRCTHGVCIAPSLLGENFAHLAEAVHALEGTEAERLHIDVMDGDFVPNFTFGTDTVRSLRSETDLPFEVHLMIQKPERHIETFASAGADALTVHYEACQDLSKTLAAIRELGCRAGGAINPETPANVLSASLPECDLALVMTIHPGFGGQNLIPETLDKVREVREEIDRRGLETEVEVDGGVTPLTTSDCVHAGASVLVAGTAIFRDPSGVSHGVEALQSAVPVNP